MLITGTVDGPPDGWLLAEVPMERLMDDPSRFESIGSLDIKPDGTFTATLPRFRDRAGLRHDRLLSRWQLAKVAGSGHLAQSHARYADFIACRSPQLSPANPKNKKGLGGWNSKRIPGELKELGITAVTVNVMIHSLVASTAHHPLHLAGTHLPRTPGRARPLRRILPRGCGQRCHGLRHPARRQPGTRRRPDHQNPRPPGRRARGHLRHAQRHRFRRPRALRSHPQPDG